jgi:hypothetical protein
MSKVCRRADRPQRITSITPSVLSAAPSEAKIYSPSLGDGDVNTGQVSKESFIENISFFRLSVLKKRTNMLKEPLEDVRRQGMRLQVSKIGFFGGLASLSC